jgi:hypothetical protein
MVDPDDPDGHEARDVRKVGRPDPQQLVAELRAAFRADSISSTSSVAAIAKTPSLKASSRAVPISFIASRHVRPTIGASSTPAPQACFGKVVARARDHCLAPARQSETPFAEDKRYGRMFANLPPLSVDDDELLVLGVVGCICDGGIACADGSSASGWPMFGQLVAHDITADRSPLAMKADPDALRNFHAPRANLEPLYSGGSAAEPYLFTLAVDPSWRPSLPAARERFGIADLLALVG